ncbi:MAG: S1 RNA-binding domain-containing protein [Clostridia bacterium]|nr:S1 RNA-binding domain-containing protein [Clostridia bacterium]
MQLEPGTIIEGKVTGITPFGAFISFGDGKTGLVHISEIALGYVKNVQDHLKENDMVKAKILSVDQNGKISLSIKQALSNERPRDKKPERSQTPKRPEDIDWSKKARPTSFEDMMAKFKQDSDEKLSDMKKAIDSKRGSSYRRSSGSF